MPAHPAHRVRTFCATILPGKSKSKRHNGFSFDVQPALHAVLGLDVTRIDGIGPYVALKLVAECGTVLLGGLFAALRDASPDYWGGRIIQRHLLQVQLGEIHYLL
jgi:hypothetical protein